MQPYERLLNLVRCLDSRHPGPVAETTELERVLTDVWGDLHSDDDSMGGHKLAGRLEQVEWHPPLLTFTIERHGGTVRGSTRGELQHWTVDVRAGTATSRRAGHRQLAPMAERLDVTPLVDEVARSIVEGRAHGCVRRLADGRVHVVVARLFPDSSGFKRTVQGRRKRFREALIERLRANGWTHLGGITFGNE
jgi:hypothetical protein